MPPERGSFEAVIEDEGTRGHHPELHTPYLENTIVIIDEWKFQHPSLEKTSTKELVEWKEDFQLLEQERLSGQRVHFDGIKQFVDRVEQIIGDSPDQKLQEAGIRLRNLETRIHSSVQEYLNAVKYHSRQSQTIHLQENGVQRLQNASDRRGVVHDTLIDVLDSFRLAATERFPKKELQSLFQPGELEELLSHAIFSKLELSKKGKSRMDIGEWAMNIGLAEQAKIIREVIEAEEAAREVGVA